MAFGHLVDPDGEFFIVRQEAAAAAAAQPAAHDTSMSLDDTLLLLDLNERSGAADKPAQFLVLPERIPMLLSIEQAQSICFVGRSMLIVAGVPNRTTSFCIYFI